MTQTVVPELAVKLCVKPANEYDAMYHHPEPDIRRGASNPITLPFTLVGLVIDVTRAHLGNKTETSVK